MNFKSSESLNQFSDNDSGFVPFEESHSPALVEHDKSTVAPVLSKHEYSKDKNNKSPLKAGEENFISEYYSNSRLHHLSMWKSELKKFADSIHKNNIENINQNQIVDDKRHSKLIMHVDLDSFFVSVSLKLNPEMMGKPVAVCHSSSQGTLNFSITKYSKY